MKNIKLVIWKMNINNQTTLFSHNQSPNLQQTIILQSQPCFLEQLQRNPFLIFNNRYSDVSSENKRKKCFLEKLYYDDIGEFQIRTQSYTKSSQLKKVDNIRRRMIKQGLYPFRREHCPVLRELMADAFLQNNPIWNSGNLTREDFYHQIDLILTEHLESAQRTKQKYGDEYEVNYIFYENDEIVSGILTYEIGDYIEIKKNQKIQDIKLQLFKKIEIAGKELITFQDLQSYPKGKTTFGSFGFCDSKKKYSSLKKALIVLSIMSKLKSQGFRYEIGRFSNEKAFGVYQKVGAVSKRIIYFGENKLPLYFYELDKQCPTFVALEEKMQQLMQNERKKCRRQPSL